VQRFGSLTWDGWDPTKGDSVHLVIFNAIRMRQFLQEYAGEQTRPVLPPGQISSLTASVLWDPIVKAPRWELRPNTLLDALWLQFGQALTSGSQIRQCQHCADWFEAGRGTGRRLDAKFCCDEHRTAFNSLKRSREK